MPSELVAGSFRDPSGFVFRCEGVLYRQVNEVYRDNYDRLVSSGLYDRLAEAGLLVSHEEVSGVLSPFPENAYKVIRPEAVDFVSYPYEWCFSQIKDAALATLRIQQIALEHGMSLKDCSAYNIQFHRGRPLFIDTLSFEDYVEGTPWTPYRQFCQHFLAPVVLMSRADVRLNNLLRDYIDGIPLDLASKLLPYRSRWSFPLLLHIHLHARSQERYSDKPVERDKFSRKVSRTALMGLLDSLEAAIRRQVWKAGGTEWAEYYSDDSYTSRGFEHKQQLVTDYLRDLAPATVWDMGANNGLYSRIAAEQGAFALAFDIDPACVEMNYLEAVKSNQTRILPLLLDLTNPSPALGWANDERLTLPERGHADVALALALIHHLAISNNVPLRRVADYFSKLCTHLIIEFVPKTDHKVRRLLATREDVFPSYTQEGFERAFDGLFSIVRSDRIAESERTLYLMRRT